MRTGRRCCKWSGCALRATQLVLPFDSGVNGEGTLVYPGRAVGYDGIAPSLRLKALRDAIEDYEKARTRLAQMILAARRPE